MLPIFCFDPYDAPNGLKNYWGYSPLNWFTPHHSFISKTDSCSARNEFRKFVAACHDNNIEVLLDVVYNHTAEGNENGPIISGKGFGESSYYQKNEQGEFIISFKLIIIISLPFFSLIALIIKVMFLFF